MAYAVQSRTDVENDVDDIDFSTADAEILYDTTDSNSDRHS